MIFRNEGNAVQVRIKDNGGYKWELVYTGEIIDLPEEIGLAHGFERVTTQGKIGKKIVETKQFENSFQDELLKIKGIAKKTAEDIMEIFTKQGLIEAIKQNKKLPFKDDIEKKLRKKYGKQS